MSTRAQINRKYFIFFSELFIERHENVTIIFADICKFTELTTRLSVDKLVKTLNDLFGKFDSAAEVRHRTQGPYQKEVLTTSPSAGLPVRGCLYEALKQCNSRFHLK